MSMKNDEVPFKGFQVVDLTGADVPLNESEYASVLKQVYECVDLCNEVQAEEGTASCNGATEAGADEQPRTPILLMVPPRRTPKRKVKSAKKRSKLAKKARKRKFTLFSKMEQHKYAAAPPSEEEAPESGLPKRVKVEEEARGPVSKSEPEDVEESVMRHVWAMNAI